MRSSRVRHRLKIIAAFVLLVSGAGLYGCVATRLPNVALAPRAEEASPPVLGAFGDDPPVQTWEDWQTRRAPLLRDAFAANVFGAWPAPTPVNVAEKQVLAADAFDGAGVMEQWRVELGALGAFSMLVITPANAQGPAPVIVMQNFCGNASAFPRIDGIAGSDFCGGWQRPIVTMIFGDAIITPPVREILDAGYAVAMFYPGDVVPDSATAAETPLAALTPPETPPSQRTGAIAAWAWLYLRALEALSTDSRFDAARIVLWGHSRNGKSALLAAAMDARPAAVITLQPGTGGGSLQRDDVGESIAAITETYPHWFAPAYAAYAGREAELPVDTHQLIALIAPRPVLLTAARRDQWSDPHGAFRAAQAAAAVYALAGAPPFTQTDLRAIDLSAPLVTYMRPGLHGVHGSDWDKALAFLDARLAQ